MNSATELTYFNQIKDRFSVEKGTIVFISLTSQSVDELKAQVFNKKNYRQYDALLDEHLKNKKPYAVLDGIDKAPIFYLACKEFGREIDLTAGKVTYFELNPFEEREVDMEKVRAEFAQLGQLLSRNSKAS